MTAANYGKGCSSQRQVYPGGVKPVYRDGNEWISSDKRIEEAEKGESRPIIERKVPTSHF